MPPQYMIGNPPSLPAAFYGLQSPQQQAQAAAAAAATMYSAYGGAATTGATAAGLEDLATLQRNAGLHTLVGAAAQQQQQSSSSNSATSQAGGTHGSQQPQVPQPGGSGGAGGAKSTAGAGNVVGRQNPSSSSSCYLSQMNFADIIDSFFFPLSC